MLKKLFKILLILMLSLVLISCGDKKETPKEAINKGLAAIKNLEIKTAKNYFDLSHVEDEEIIEENDIDFSDIEKKQLEAVKLYLDRFEYQTLEEEINGDSAKVLVNIKTIEMQDLFIKYISYALELGFSDMAADEQLIEEKMEEKIIELLKSEELKTVENKVNFNLNKVNDQWKIVLNKNSLDALLGGIISAAENLEN